jgi:hypothetical protein
LQLPRPLIPEQADMSVGLVRYLHFEPKNASRALIVPIEVLIETQQFGKYGLFIMARL